MNSWFKPRFFWLQTFGLFFPFIFIVDTNIEVPIPLSFARLYLSIHQLPILITVTSHPKWVWSSWLMRRRQNIDLHIFTDVKAEFCNFFEKLDVSVCVITIWHIFTLFSIHCIYITKIIIIIRGFKYFHLASNFKF